MREIKFCRVTPPANSSVGSSERCAWRATQVDYTLVLPVMSELLLQACLLQYGICGVAGLDLGVDGKTPAADRAEPDFVIALALPLEAATLLPKYALEFG